MLAHLKFLTRTLPRIRPEATAVAVYAEPAESGFHILPAMSLGYEGVACVDDAARAVVLYSKLWRDYHYPWLAPEIVKLLNFVVHMQRDDGAFSNFITDWSGEPNVESRSSLPGGPWWTARAMRALATGLQVHWSTEFDQAFQRGRPWLHRVQSLGALAAGIEAEIDYWRVTRDPASARFCIEAAHVIAKHRVGQVLADDSETPHFWGHHQEVALIRVAVELDQPQLTRIANASAFALFGDAVVSGFASRDRTQPYEVACAARAFEAIYRVSGNTQAGELGRLARRWFLGRNAASLPVYDFGRQLAYDGVDGASISPNSGAESNIETALALYSVLPWEHLAATLNRNQGGLSEKPM